MNWIIFRQRLFNILSLRGHSLLNLTGLLVAVFVFFVISHISSFELGFDKYHIEYENIYRVKNTRVYQNLIDASAGCPPATGPTIKNEIPEIAESARIKPVSASILEVSKGKERLQFYHNDLFYADESIFRIFTYTFISGVPDEALKEVGSAVVTKEFGLKYFGNENPLGEKFTCNNDEGIVEYTIKAVIHHVPANSYLTFDCLLSYTSLISKNSIAQDGWGWNAFNTFVRLKPNANVEEINKKLEEIVTKYSLSRDDMTRTFALQPIESLHLHSDLRHEIGRRSNAFMINILISIAVFILLVAWVNYINISTAKSKKQILEINTRKALGYTRKQLFYEQVYEALILNFLAVVIAIMLIRLLSPAFKNLYHLELYNLSLANWSVILAFSFFVSLLSGLCPALVLFDRKISLTGKFTTGKSLKLRNCLVVFQFAVSILFIIATILILKQIKFIEHKQDELAINDIITLKSLTTTEEVQRSQNAFIDEVSQLSGIKNISVSNSIPGGDYTNVAGGIRPIGAKGSDGIKCYFIDINERFLDLYNIELIAGENFRKYSSGNDDHVIINATAAKMLGYDKPSDAINKKMIFGELDNAMRTIIGVTEDYHQKSLQEPIHPSVFNYKMAGNYISIKYSHSLNSSIVPLLQKSWKKMAPNQPFDYEFNNVYYAAQYTQDRIFGRLVTTFAILIVFVSCIGLYSLARFAINSKVKEIGIRKVNGANPWGLITMLNKNFVIKIIMAFVIALPMSWYAMHKWLQNFAYKTDLSWWVFAWAGLLALGVALLTVSWQSWRAATRNPVEALRYE